MTPVTSRLLVWLVFPVVGWALGTQRSAQDRRFPHQRHEKLFPVCDGCHAGIVSGAAAGIYPEPDVCLRCHDGTRAAAIEVQRPVRRSSNLRFSHTAHWALTGDSATCQACHATASARGRLDVAGPNPQRCLQCHAHASDSHLSLQAGCVTCHVPLNQAASLSVERVASLPRPPWHDTVDFQESHGALASDRIATCATCHARETCERCHANADRIASIRSLGRDSRVAALESDRQPEYGSPATHDERDWALDHGAGAPAGVNSCANCHTQSSCLVCHRAGSGASRTTIARLPGGEAQRGRGVAVERITARVHGPDVATRHGTPASSGSMDCGQCHAPQTCAGCHSGADSRAFHASNFVERHAVDVFASTADCQSCHSTERFCRDCHTRTGVAARSGMNSAFHTGVATWILSHGQAARTGMESCASCHRQADCVRCHSASTGWGVNPHGAGFRAGELASRNSASCRWCHLAVPRGGR